LVNCQNSFANSTKQIELTKFLGDRTINFGLLALDVPRIG